MVQRPIRQLQLLLQRKEIMKHVVSGVTDRTQLVNYIGDSRSTVYRALDDLAEEGLLVEKRGNYSPTPLAEILFEEVIDLHEMSTTVNKAEAIIQSMDGEDLVPHLFQDASVTLPTRYAPNKPFSAVSEFASGKSTLRVLIPGFIPQVITALSDHMAEAEVEVVVEEDSLATLERKSAVRAELGPLIERKGIRTTSSEIPFILLVTDRSSPSTCLVGYDNGRILGTIETTAPKAYQWATDLYMSHHSSSTLVGPEAVKMT